MGGAVQAIRRGVTTLDMKIYIWQLFNGLDFLAAVSVPPTLIIDL